MKTLVTGASGFVGECLCEALIAHDVGFIPMVRESTNQIHFRDVVVKELTANTLLNDVLKDVGIVIHLANRAHVMNESYPDAYLEFKKTNVDATINLARQAIESNVKRFIFVSSIKVNGESTNLYPFNEKSKPKPEDDYGITKLEAEKALKDLCADSEMELVIIRPPIVYGPGVKANFLNLIKLCKLIIPLPFKGVNNKRSLIYVKNLVSFIELCMTHPKAGNNTFLISDNNDQSIESLIKTLRLNLNKPVLLFKVPKGFLVSLLKILGKAKLVDRLIKNLQVDMSKANQLLGWTPPYTFDEGIEETIKSFQRYYE